MAAKLKNRWLKWIVPLVLIGAGAGVGVGYFKFRNRQAPEYQTVPISRGELVQVVTATGQLNPVVNVQVGSQISGIIQKLMVDFNSPVKSNQVVAQIDAATYQANLQQADGNLANAKAGLELAQIDAERASALVKEHLIPKSDYDKAIADLHRAEAMVKINEASVSKAKVDLARCTIYAPIDGVVISRDVDVGQTVAASLSAPTLFVIANDLAKMQIDANVSEADVGGVEVGQDVEFIVDAFPQRTFRGKVVQVRNSPITVQNVVTYDTVIGVSNEDLKLKPGMTATVSIIIARRENALKIPNTALRFRPPDLAATNRLSTSSSFAQVSSNAPGLTDRGVGTGGSAGGRMAAGGRRQGEGRVGGLAAGAERMRGERPSFRTVYILPVSDTSTNASRSIKPQPVRIRTGISDGIYTEVVGGLSEGAQIITGLSTSASASSRPAMGASPFGGGMRRF